MKLSKKNKDALLMSVHRMIGQYSNETITDIENKTIENLINYPPNGGLTNEEFEELEKLKLNPELKSALRKVIASNAADMFFSFFCLVDGVSDPTPESEDLIEVALVDSSDDLEADSMLHDDFYKSYWDWRDKRGNPGWKLDILKD